MRSSVLYISVLALFSCSTFRKYEFYCLVTNLFIRLEKQWDSGTVLFNKFSMFDELTYNCAFVRRMLNCEYKNIKPDKPKYKKHN